MLRVMKREQWHLKKKWPTDLALEYDKRTHIQTFSQATVYDSFLNRKMWLLK